MRTPAYFSINPGLRLKGLPLLSHLNALNSWVDDSGIWGAGGMFGALDRLSPNIAATYEQAHEAGDLHLEDVHLLPVNGAKPCLSLCVVSRSFR